MGSPTILDLSVKARFSHLWLRSIQGVRLNAHCARAFIGPYADFLTPHGLRENIPHSLQLTPARAYYLCGVASPYVWADNLHVAFAYSLGDTLDVNEHGVHLQVADAVPQNIDKSLTRDHP